MSSYYIKNRGVGQEKRPFFSIAQLIAMQLVMQKLANKHGIAEAKKAEIISLGIGIALLDQV